MFVPSFLALWWPKIDRKSGFPQLFAKTVGSIHFIPGIYTYGVSLWNPIDFCVRALIFGPLVAKNWPKIGVSATFRENCQLDSFHPWDLYLWGKSLDPYRFSCSCPQFWPSGGQKLTENRGFRNFSRKLFLRFPNFLYQLQPQYLPYHDTLVGRVMPKFFSNKFFLNDSHQCSYHNDLKIGLFVGYFLMGWVLIRAGVYCPHLWAQLVGSDNALSPGQCQAIIWTSDGIFSIWTLGTNFSEILREIQTFSLRKVHLKMSSVKCCPFYLGLKDAFIYWGTFWNCIWLYKCFLLCWHMMLETSRDLKLKSLFNSLGPNFP